MTRERMERTNRIRIKWKNSRGFKIAHKYLSGHAYISCAATEKKRHSAFHRGVGENINFHSA